MPVIRPSGRGEPLASLRGHLTDLLLKELMGEATRRGPVVFEDPVSPDAIDVTVVWEAWQALSPDDRTSIIRDAYARYSRTLEASLHCLDPNKRADLPMIPRVMMAIGATWKDAIELNLLPYSISPNVRAGEVDPDELERIMIESGAIQAPKGVQLRFPKAQMASDAHSRLMEEMPEAFWSIVEDVRDGR